MKREYVKYSRFGYAGKIYLAMLCAINYDAQSPKWRVASRWDLVWLLIPFIGPVILMLIIENRTIKPKWKPGDQLIFIEDGGVLTAKKGNVLTFSNFFKDRWSTFNGIYNLWQCQELHDMGNHDHNFSIRGVELFDPKIHFDYRTIDIHAIREMEKDFTDKYGG